MAQDPLAPSTEVLNPEDSGNVELPTKVVNIINLVRTHMRDFPELNRLIAGEETSDRMILTCLMLTVDDFNYTPPLLGNYRITNFPSISLLVRGTIICILESVGILQMRNHLQYSDGQGIQVGISDKAPQLMQWATMMRSSYDMSKVNIKKSINLNGALRGCGIASEYSSVNGSYEDYI